MPRVSDEHLESRRTQIIEAAVRCFARQGFHATSMQDVFTESGLSAGAVYRYFPGKSALVRATSEFVFDRLNTVFSEQVEASPPASPAALVHAATSQVGTLMVAPGIPIARLAMSAWAEALRDPDVADLVRTIIEQVQTRLTEVVRSWQDTGHLHADVDPSAVATATYSLMIGFLVQNLLAGGVDPDAYRAGIAALSAVDAEVPGGHA